MWIASSASSRSLAETVAPCVACGGARWALGSEAGWQLGGLYEDLQAAVVFIELGDGNSVLLKNRDDLRFLHLL